MEMKSEPTEWGGGGHRDLDNPKNYSSNVYTASTLNCRNALDFDLPHNILVALDIYIIRIKRACF